MGALSNVLSNYRVRGCVHVDVVFLLAAQKRKSQIPSKFNYAY
jgi:hypothetical protein